MGKVGTDLTQLNRKIYLSRYIEMAALNYTYSDSIINHLKSMFARHGIPCTVVSDKGPQYASKEFCVFAKDYGFTHITISSKHASANGKAERAVRTLKKLLRASKDP